MLCLRTSARLFCVAPLCARASFCLASLSRGLRFTLFTRLHVYPGFRLTYFCVLRGLRIPSLFFGLLRLHYGLPRMLLFVFSAFSCLSFFLVLDLSRCCCFLLGLFLLESPIWLVLSVLLCSLGLFLLESRLFNVWCLFLGLFLLVVLGVLKFCQMAIDCRGQ